jgi:uncharacterized protein involved in exopolysaccharide biosynthesis
VSDPQDDFTEQEKRPGSPVDMARVYLFCTRFWFWLLIGFAMSAVGGVMIARALIPYQYEATCTLLANPTGSESIRPVELQAEADSVKLSSNLDAIRGKLGVRLPNEVFSRLIHVEFDIQRSNLLAIQASWSSAQQAARLANTAAETFIEYEKRRTLTEREEQVKKLQADLDAAAARLANHRQVYSTLRKEKGVSDITIETRLAVEEAAKLRFEADKSTEEAKRIRSVMNTNTRPSDSAAAARGSDTVIESRETVGIRYDLAQARARLATVSSRLPPEHPTVKAIEQEVKALEKKLPQQASHYRSTNAREALEKVLIGQSKAEAAAVRAEQRVRQLADNESEMTVILTDIQVAERHVEDLKGRLAVARDAVRDTSTTFEMLTAAQPPPYPVKSNRKVVAMAIGMGLVGLILAVSLLSILWRMRAYTAAEVAYWTKSPVVGSSTWPRDADALNALVRDLDDFLPMTTGSTMVVSLADEDHELVTEVTRQIISSEREDSSRYTTSDSSRVPKARTSGGSVSNSGPIGVTKSEIFPWNGANSEPALRRAARLADRVLVLVRSGTSSAFDLAALTTLLGRQEGVGILLLGIDSAFTKLPDRVGDVEQFWKAKRKRFG